MVRRGTPGVQRRQLQPRRRPAAAGRRVTFRVGDGARSALIGPNGTGKTTLLRIVAGDLPPDDGAVGRSGGLGVMRAVHRLGPRRLDGPRPAAVRVPAAVRAAAAAAVDAAELAMMERDDEPAPDALRAGAGRLGATPAATTHETALRRRAPSPRSACPTTGRSTAGVTACPAASRSGWCSRRCCAGRDEVLLLDEPDNYLDVPAKLWLEERLHRRRKTVLFVCHDRELLASAASRIVTLEPGVAGAASWVHGGAFATYHEARDDRNSRLEELRRRWDEEHAKLKALVLHVQDQGGVQRRLGLALPGRADPAGQVRGGRPAAGGAAASRT